MPLLHEWYNQFLLLTQIREPLKPCVNKCFQLVEKSNKITLIKIGICGGRKTKRFKEMFMTSSLLYGREGGDGIVSVT